MIQRINETKSWFFEKIKNIDKHLANMTKQKRRPKLIKSEMKGDIITNTNEIQRIVREYFENLYSNKLENLEEMDKFLDACNQPKLNQDINHLRSPTICNEIETVIKSISTKKSPGPSLKF
jgi:hypothetical protein